MLNVLPCTFNMISLQKQTYGCDKKLPSVEVPSLQSPPYIKPSPSVAIEHYSYTKKESYQ